MYMNAISATPTTLYITPISATPATLHECY